MTSAERATKLWECVTDMLRGTWIGVATEQIDAAIAEALGARWVPVRERLPEPGSYLVTVDAGVVCRAYYDGDGWTSDDWIVVVLAWQPIPAPWVAP